MIQIAKLQFNPFGENTYLLYSDTNDAIIVDPGCSNESEQKVLESFIEKKSLKPRLVICTHGHVDHVAGAAWAVSRWSIPFAMSSEDREIASSNLDFAASMGFALDSVPEIAIDLSSTKNIDLLGEKIGIVKTPGHTPGGVCLFIESQKWLITGDTLFRESIGRTDLPGGDYNKLMNSIIKNIISLGTGIKIFPGHGPDSTLDHEVMYNPFITDVIKGDVKY